KEWMNQEDLSSNNAIADRQFGTSFSKYRYNASDYFLLMLPDSNSLHVGAINNANTFTELTQGDIHAIRNGWARKNGRQYGSTPYQGRPRMRGLRQVAKSS